MRQHDETPKGRQTKSTAYQSQMFCPRCSGCRWTWQKNDPRNAIRPCTNHTVGPYRDVPWYSDVDWSERLCCSSCWCPVPLVLPYRVKCKFSHPLPVDGKKKQKRKKIRPSRVNLKVSIYNLEHWFFFYFQFSIHNFISDKHEKPTARRCKMRSKRHRSPSVMGRFI